MKEIAIFTTSSYLDDYGDTVCLLRNMNTGFHEVTDDEYETLVTFNAYHCNIFIVTKVPLVSESGKTIRDYINDANKLKESHIETNKKLKAIAEKRKKSTEKSKIVKDLKNIEKLRNKLTALEKLKDIEDKEKENQ